VKYVTGGDIRGPITISPDGTRVAYEVKAPDIKEDRNVFELYVKEPWRGRENDKGELIGRGENIVGLQWTKDGRSILMLARDGGDILVKKVEVTSKTESVFFRAPTSILEYALDRDEDTIVYSAAYRQNVDAAPKNASKPHPSFSQLITVDPLLGDAEGVRRGLFMSRRDSSGKWSDPKRITIEDPFTHHSTSAFGELQHLSLSPDGTRVVFAYDTEALPSNWTTHPYEKLVSEAGAPAIITVMHNLQTGKTIVPINSIYAGTIPFWSKDSKTFIMTAPAPIDSGWERRDIAEKRIAGFDANMYWINIDTGEIQEVMAHVPDHHQSPLAWTADNDLVVKTYSGSISTFHHAGNAWVKVSTVTIPFKTPYPFSSLTSNGKAVVGVYETTTTPPNLYILDLQTGDAQIITNLNPQLSNVTLAKAAPIRWYTSDGMEVHGLLFLPTNYVPGHRYPLVIQTKGQQDNSSFVCDSGVNHDPAFAPQPMANSGMMYLIRTAPENYDQEKEIARRETSKYPAGIAEAFQQMDIWESVVRSLGREGMIDPSRVGIIGFSRTGWYTEFMLTHGTVHFAAASVADNVDYSLSEYWLVNAASKGFDNIYGGSPYGPALKNWIKYSMSFNLQRMHTPLLIEEMGHGVGNDVPGEIPPLLATKYEILVGLEKLKRPVELYFFPNQDHMPDAPQARMESLQQNVDWFRFWLQDYEDPDPAKESQYSRWRHLRMEQLKSYASE
jgi:dipeptidyl aminopeptidase/acylaminoacyl peptidase